MSVLPYLNFARPTITESMADAVKETLLTLHIASGPRVQEFEQALSDYHGGWRHHRRDGSGFRGLQYWCCPWRQRRR